MNISEGCQLDNNKYFEKFIQFHDSVDCKMTISSRHIW